MKVFLLRMLCVVSCRSLRRADPSSGGVLPSVCESSSVIRYNNTPLHLQKVDRRSHSERKKGTVEQNIFITVKVCEIFLVVTVNTIQICSSLLALQEVAETKGKPRNMTVHLNTCHGSVRIYGKVRVRLVIKRR
jgi:hypothetical protein